MNDKIKSKRVVRRRRTTRRLTRKPIRVPEDKVPRVGQEAGQEPDAPFEATTTAVGHFEAPDAYQVMDRVERAATISLPPDQLYDMGVEPNDGDVDDHDVNVDGDLDDEADDELDSRTISLPPPPGLNPTADPASAGNGVHPGEAAMDLTRGDDPDESVETLRPPAEDAYEGGAASDALESDDEPTRPRIEITDEMAMAAGRLTSPDPIAALSVSGEDDSDTDPQIQAFDDQRPGQPVEEAPVSSVIVAPARVISDMPGRRAERESDPDAAGVTELDDQSLEALADGLNEPEEEHDGVDVDDSMVLEESDARDGREPRTPPPPPPKSKKRPPPPPARPKSIERATWWQTFFDEEYLRNYSAPTPTQIERQCDFVCESLDVSKGQSVLDLGCGVGLHAVELARRGLDVVGLDLSVPMLQAAVDEASASQVEVTWEQGDMRELDYEGRFDAVVSLGSSFGFFDDDLQLDLLKRINRALKPNGRFFIDVVNRDYVQAAQPNLVWYQGEDCICMEESDFNYFTSRLMVKKTVMREGGRQHESEFSLRLYSLHEMGHLIQSAGFRVTEVSAQEATRGMFFGCNSPRMLLLAEKVVPVDKT